MGFIKDIAKKLTTYAIILILLGVGIKFIGKDMLWKRFNDQIKTISTLTKTNADHEETIHVLRRDKDGLEDSIATINVFNTNDNKILVNEIKRLKLEKYDLEGELSAVRSGQGSLIIEDFIKADELLLADTSKTDCFTFIPDPDSANIIRARLNATLKIKGFETTDKYGNRRVIEEVFLECENSDKVIYVDWESDFKFLKPEHKLWHWWNPKLHSDIIPNNPTKFGMSINVMSFGTDTYIETTSFYFMCFGIVSDFKEEAMITLFPIKYNVGQLLPLIDNLNLGIGGGWNFHNTVPSLQFSVGMVH